ncbi:MAG: bL17 family ribosomal protein, partial [Oribacterium sp.]
MGMYRKLGRNSSQRRALLRAQTTAVLEHGRIFTTEARAKEVRRKIERLITLGIRERDNFEEVSIQAKVPRKDASGKRVKELVDGKRRTVYD